MDPESFVSSAVLLLVVAATAVALFRHFGLGSILGLLVAGILLGPHTPGPSITSDVEDLRHFAELGVVLLLFVIGLEMHPGRLWEMRRTLFGLGSLQVLISGGCLAAYFRLFQPDWSTALLLGMSLALSSTALVMQLLQERAEIASHHGQTAFAILLMQDLAVVPLLAMIPVLADVGPLPVEIPLWEQLAIVALLVGAVILVGRYLVPWLLERLMHQGNRDAFFLVVLASVFLAAFAMKTAGLSMALGAFLMGVMLSGSRYNLQIQALVEPHKGLLMSLFFVAVGMSVDIGVLAQQPERFAMHLGSLLAIKILVLFVLCLLFGITRAAAVRVAFLLSQAGEFGFVLFGAAKALEMIDDRTFVLVVGVISVSMLLTPLLVKLGEGLARLAPDREGDVDPSLRLESNRADQGPPRVVIGGFGRVGHTIGAILSGNGIPYIAFESSPQLVANWRREGCPVYFGDMGDPHLLEAVDIEQVELVVLTIDDQRAAIKATELIRAYAPGVKIVARARDLTTCDALLRAGATRAFPEAVEASLRLAAETLSALDLATEEVDILLDNARGGGYALVREEVPEDLGRVAEPMARTEETPAQSESGAA
ncbi:MULTISPECIES: cation:proton antiporter domain-containing protein [Thiorhodovibrio]|uniref:cation:proton antiporter domain-containing protein n=1 Tax=Thiorhodovibrio TaxID=61593 RepID=UPI001914A1E3|nr:MULTISPECIES: cation:proton antiporter [Thiorhodovibrio]MBK5967879.1 portal protein [Thiorhodovibrio winogradskyi]WPL14105.1 K(+)/H(+) antiporter [Thiorhodovibrio litoralis]